MKKCVSVYIDDDKYLALKMGVQQKGTSVEEELAQAMEGLYQKVVPANVHTYLDMKQEIQKSKRKTQGSSAVGD